LLRGQDRGRLEQVAVDYPFCWLPAREDGVPSSQAGCRVLWRCGGGTSKVATRGRSLGPLLNRSARGAELKERTLC